MRNRILLTIAIILVPLFFSAQIKVAEHIKASSIATKTDNKLYFVDFWATWCGPCITVSKYLTGLQRQFPEDFYIMSLTQENPDIVKRFITKHQLELAVAIDYDGETFSKYAISSLPHGILFNAEGEKLWEGHPAEFKFYHLNRFLKQQNTRIAVDSMFPQEAYKHAIEVIDDDFYKGFEAKALENYQSTLLVQKKATYLELSGDLQSILAYTEGVFKAQIEVAPSLNTFYRMRFKYDTKSFQNKTKTVLKYLKLKKSENKTKGDVLFFNLETSNFWDTNQIDWGNDTPNFLIGDTDIKANNVSLIELNYQLSNLLELPIIISDAKLATTLHDWEVHYKYFDLMSSVFYDTYGIKVDKRVGAYTMYKIRK